LDAQQWAAFQDVLDAPPHSTPRLRKLLEQPSVFERGRKWPLPFASKSCNASITSRVLIADEKRWIDSHPLCLTEPAGRRSQTYVALSGAEITGFYTLVVGQIEYADAPERLTKGLARHPVPIMLLARLATALSWQGNGIGSSPLKDAMLRTLQAADIAGIRALAVHAKDDQARAFYERFDLIPSPADPYHLFILLKELRAALQKR